MAFQTITDADIDQYFATATPIKLSRSEKKLEHDNVEKWVNAYLCSEEGRKQVLEEARRLQGEATSMYQTIYSTGTNDLMQTYQQYMATSGYTRYQPYQMPPAQTPPLIDWTKLQWEIKNPPSPPITPTTFEENLMRLFKAYVVKATKEEKKKTTYDVILDDTLIAKDREAALLKVGQMIADKANEDDTLHINVSEVFSFPA